MYTSIIVLGSRAIVFPIQSQYQVLNFTAETVLQFVGAANKFLDVIATGSLAALTNAINTVRLTHPKFDGITLLDLDLKEALFSPIQTLVHARLRLKSWRDGRWKTRASTIGLIVFTAATSLCIWLLPLASNTLMIPKLIWHPLLKSDGWPGNAKRWKEEHLIAPRVLIDDVRWDIPASGSSHEIGLKDTEDILSSGRLASLTYSSFFDFNEEYLPGWNEAKRYPGKYSTMYTHMRPATVQAASVRAVDVENLFKTANTYGPSYAKHAVRKWSDMNVTTPSVTVSCKDGVTDLPSTPGIRISGIQNSSSIGSFTVYLDSVKELNFSSVVCDVALQQHLFSVGTNSLDGGGISLDIKKDCPDCSFSLYPVPQKTDRQLILRLQIVLQVVTPQLDILSLLTLRNLTENSIRSERTISPFLRFLVSRARRLPDMVGAEGNDIAHIARLLAFWAQHTLTLSHWDLSTSTTETTYSRRVHYMVYASGPRQRYQLAILIVPCWLLTVIIGGVGFCAWYGLRKTEVGWEILPMYSLAGMTVASIRSPRTDALDQGLEKGPSNAKDEKNKELGALTTEMLSTRLYVRQTNDGRRVLTDKRDAVVSNLTMTKS
jgi:hypothetical protein